MRDDRRSRALAKTGTASDASRRGRRHHNLISSTGRIAMETARIARILSEMGTLLEVRGENAFRCRAYHTAAQALKGLPSDLGEMIADRSLSQVPGIGGTMLAKITQLATTGHLPSFDELKKTTPPGLVAL